MKLKAENKTIKWAKQSKIKKKKKISTNFNIPNFLASDQKSNPEQKSNIDEVEANYHVQTITAIEESLKLNRKP